MLRPPWKYARIVGALRWRDSRTLENHRCSQRQTNIQLKELCKGFDMQAFRYGRNAKYSMFV